jgi:hypothetical protein
MGERPDVLTGERRERAVRSLLRAAWVLRDFAVAVTDSKQRRHVRSRMVSGRGGYYGGEEEYQVKPDGLYYRLKGEGEHGQWFGVVPWPNVFETVKPYATPEAISALTNACQVSAEHDRTFVANPGPYGDADTWWEKYGGDYYAEARRLRQIEEAAVEAFWFGEVKSVGQLALFEVSAA